MVVTEGPIYRRRRKRTADRGDDAVGRCTAAIEQYVEQDAVVVEHEWAQVDRVAGPEQVDHRVHGRFDPGLADLPVADVGPLLNGPE